MRRSLSIGGSSSVQWRKAGRSWRLPLCFCSLLCVRIEIDQLQCVNCWVIIHFLSVSCTKINHSRLAYIEPTVTNCDISDNNSQLKCVIADVTEKWRHSWRLIDITITCKRMQRSLSIGGSSSVQWRKAGRSWRLPLCFCSLLCVRIEIDQLQCVNCWVIIHFLSVSCTKINHSRYALVIWSSLQLTSKQWIIKQQFTAGADLFLKYKRQKWVSIILECLWLFNIEGCTIWICTVL